MSELSEILGLWPLWAAFVSLAVLGGYLVVRGLVAFRGRRSVPMLLLSIGIAIVAIGTPVAWTMMYFSVGDLLWCTIVSTLTSAVGVGLLVASVHVRGPFPSGPDP